MLRDDLMGTAIFVVGWVIWIISLILCVIWKNLWFLGLSLAALFLAYKFGQLKRGS